MNLASRLETAANPGEILNFHKTYAIVQDEFVCKEHGKVTVKGLTYSVTPYLVVASHDFVGASRCASCATTGVSLCRH
jgi:class 3 adenylate cyclase